MGLKKRAGRRAAREAEGAAPSSFAYDRDVAFATSEARRVKNWQRRQDDFRDLFETFAGLLGFSLLVIQALIGVSRLVFHIDAGGLFFQILSCFSVVSTLLFVQGRKNSGPIRAWAAGLALAALALFLWSPGAWARAKCAPLAPVYFFFVLGGVSYTSERHPPKVGLREELRTRTKYGKGKLI